MVRQVQATRILSEQGSRHRIAAQYGLRIILLAHVYHCHID